MRGLAVVLVRLSWRLAALSVCVCVLCSLLGIRKLVMAGDTRITEDVAQQAAAVVQADGKPLVELIRKTTMLGVVHVLFGNEGV